MERGSACLAVLLIASEATDSARSDYRLPSTGRNTDQHTLTGTSGNHRGTTQIPINRSIYIYGQNVTAHPWSPAEHPRTGKSPPHPDRSCKQRWYVFGAAEHHTHPGRICLGAPAVDIRARHGITAVHCNSDGLRETLHSMSAYQSQQEAICIYLNVRYIVYLARVREPSARLDLYTYLCCELVTCIEIKLG